MKTKKRIAAVGAVVGPAFGGTVGVLTARWIFYLASMSWDSTHGGGWGLLGAVVGGSVGAGWMLYLLNGEAGP